MIFYAYFFCCLSQNNYLCALIFSHLLNMQSHPTWVRGLKPSLIKVVSELCRRTLRGCVDWNLTYSWDDKRLRKSHPTWVRGLKLRRNGRYVPRNLSHPTWVRGLKRSSGRASTGDMLSHPTWVRGLKLMLIPLLDSGKGSHPTWVRGLKLIIFASVNNTITSHPTWVRGLKLTTKHIRIV